MAIHYLTMKLSSHFAIAVQLFSLRCEKLGHLGIWLLLAILTVSAHKQFFFSTKLPTLFFEFDFLGRHWLIRSHRFPVCSSMTHPLCTACARTTQSQILVHRHIFGPMFPLLPRFPSLWWPPHCCVCGFQFYIPQMSEIIWFLALSDWLISLTIIFSRSIHIVANGSISSFLMTEECPIVCVCVCVCVYVHI